MTDLLAGKTILITGASAGVGAHAAHLFAQESANLILTARRLPELEQVEAKIRDAGGDVLAVRADTTVAADLRKAIDTGIERWGRLDGALNNAGRSQGGGRRAEVQDDTFDAVLDVNFKGVWLAMRAEITAMTATGASGGSIVNVSSIGGTFGAPGQASTGPRKRPSSR